MIYNSFEVYLAGIRGLINLLFVPGHIVLAERKSSCLALFILNFTIVYYSADVVAFIFYRIVISSYISLLYFVHTLL